MGCFGMAVRWGCWPQGGRRETRLLGVLSFIHTTVWRCLFGKPAESLERGTDREDEYMISDRELLVNRFISVPRDMGQLNCGAFVSGIVKARTAAESRARTMLLGPTIARHLCVSMRLENRHLCATVRLRWIRFLPTWSTECGLCC